MRAFLFASLILMATLACGSAYAQETPAISGTLPPAASGTLLPVQDGTVITLPDGGEIAVDVAPAQRTWEDAKVVVLKSIDKVSALSMTFEIPVGRTVKFGESLYIKARACKKAPAFETPESAAFLQIWEKREETDPSKWIFSGWMFASSPAVSAMEHPVYDVWVLDCSNGESKDTPAEKAGEGETQPSAKDTAPDVPVSEDELLD